MLLNETTKARMLEMRHASGDAGSKDMGWIDDVTKCQSQPRPLEKGLGSLSQNGFPRSIAALVSLSLWSALPLYAHASGSGPIV